MNQTQENSQLDTRLLEKIFILVVVVTYAIDTIIRLRSRTSEPRLFNELLLLLLIPAGYFIISYLVNSRKNLKLLSIFQSLISSVAAYAFWNTLANLVQNFHRAYTVNLKMYFLTAAITGILLLVILLYLRSTKNW